MKVSPSLLKNWMSCSLKAKFAYVDGLQEWRVNAAAEFGTAVHAAFEHYNNNGDEDAAVQEFLDLWEASLKQEMDWPRRTSASGYHEKGQAQVHDFVEFRAAANDVVIGAEKRFCVPIGNHEISGIIDEVSVDEHARILYIRDYKTGFRPNADNLSLDIQMTSYAWAVAQREFWVGVEGSDKYTGYPNGEELYEKYKDYEHRVYWFDTRNGKEYFCGPRGTTDIVRLYRCIEAIEASIEAEVFMPNISAASCRFCDFQDQCLIYLNEDQLGRSIELA